MARILRGKNLLLLLVGLLLGTALGVLALVYLPARSVSGPGAQKLPPTVGSPAPDFILSELGSKPLKLSDLRGTPAVVNFWATWCEPCKKEVPLLEQTAQKYSGRLVILGVDSQEEEKIVRPFAQQFGMTYAILMDTEGTVTNLYFVKNFPTTFFIDSNGIVRAQHLGLLEEADLSKYLKTVGIAP